MLTHGETLCRPLYNYARDTTVGGICSSVGLDHDGECGAVLTVGDEHLGAVEDVFVAVPHRRRLDVLDVAAGLRLRKGQRPADFPIRHAVEPAVFLVVSAVLFDDGR